MNCPQCNEPVGDDQYGYGPWKGISGNLGGPRSACRVLAIMCGHCGVFEVFQEAVFTYKDLRSPLTADKDLRRLEKLIPACQYDRRVKA